MSTKNKCRACLDVSLSTDSVFELTMLLNEKRTPFIECFFKCTNIQLDEDDETLPQTMCESCIQSVMNMYQFRLMCESTQLLLLPKKAKKDIWEAQYLYNVPKLCKAPFFYHMQEDEVDEVEEEEVVVIESMEEGSLCFPEDVEEDVLFEELPEVKKDVRKSVQKNKIKCNQCKGMYFSKCFCISFTFKPTNVIFFSRNKITIFPT